jgi:phosphoglycolate phosphatase
LKVGAGRNVLLVDLDGTLTDPAEGIVGCFRFALQAVGREPRPDADLTGIIGPPLRGSFAEALGEPDLAEEALGHYRRRYGTEGLFEATVYEGVADALAELRANGIRLILCTAKPIVYATRVLEHFDLDRLFAAAYGAELDGRFDDKGDLIARILEDERLDPGTCVMLGDRRHDVIAATRHAIPTIGALWGYGGSQELRDAGAAALCETPAVVPAAFGRLSRASDRWRKAGS